ncbi:19144_t:CDS:2, partial [Dentiscutata erythropus]
MESDNNSGLVEEQPVNISPRHEESNDNSGLVEEQPVNILPRHVNFLLTHSEEAIDALVVGQTSEYNKGVCRIRRYACEHQGRNSTKNKTNIAENQQQTRNTSANAIKELEDFMNGFINKHTPKKKRKSHSKKSKIQQEEEEKTTSSCSSSDKENFIEIETLIVHSKRDASKKKRLKGSHELTRKQTQSQQCQNTGITKLIAKHGTDDK